MDQGTTGATTTHFGERVVPLAEKQDLVNEVFHSVADRYDVMNDLMSGGVHRLWKDAMVARLAPPKTGKLPYRVLDMAGGTGDVAERILNASVGYAEVTVSDINPDMLRVGEERAKKWRSARRHGSSSPTPKPCHSRTPRSTRTRSPSGSGTCRASMSRCRKRGGC